VELQIAQLAKKRRKEEAVAKAQEVRDIEKLAEEASEGQNSPSLKPETHIEQGGADMQTTSFSVKFSCLRE